MESITQMVGENDLVAILQDLPVGICLTDDKDRIVWVNAALCGQLGRTEGDIVGRPAGELPVRNAAHQTDEGQLLDVEGAAELGAEWVIRLDGPVVGKGDGALNVRYYLDATEMEQARRKVDRLTQALRGQVATDHTTGLLNRSSVLNQLEMQVSRSRRYHNMLSVVLLRLRCGSEVGDRLSEAQVLAVGRMLRDQTRWPDIIGHWGEFDFLLVLPETSIASAGMLRDKVAEQLALLPEFAGDDVACEARFSTAEWQKGDTALDLVHRAEEDLEDVVA